MTGSILGTRVVRVEDPELLVGQAQYVDDLAIDGKLHLAFARSTLSHARLLGVDTSAALEVPGVVAVFTADDLDLPAHHGLAVLNPACARPPLARDTVRFVGDIVAAVVADTKEAAEDGAEAIIPDFEPLPPVVDPEAALAPGAPLVNSDVPGNLAAGQRDPDDIDPLGDADVVVRGRFENQRIAVVPMEGNAIAVIPGDDGAGHDLTIYVSTQMPHGFWRSIADLFDLDKKRIRVVAPWVGGGFGGKAGVIAEHTVTIGAARALGRPVTWAEGRPENLRGMQGRGQVQYVELGLRRDGTITGMRVRIVGDAGAYGGFGGGFALGTTRMMAQGVYRIPRIVHDGAVALTTTAPTGAFRGAGRPEAAALLERIVDMAADELGIDPVELRHRNLLRPDELPLATVTGATYDSGDYPAALDAAVRLAGYDDLLAEQAARRERGDRRLLGIGVSTYVEITGFPGSEYGSVAINADGTATISVGTSGHGQGHPTSFAMIVADQLGLPLDAIRFVQSDTASVPRGGGTGGSRSLQHGGHAVKLASETVLERARQIAGRLLEADPADIVVLDDGRVGVAGVPASGRTWAELAAAATMDGGDPLAAAVDSRQDAATFPFGAHIAVVEVDAETGHVDLVRHVAVDDCGRIVNPMLVTGQQHGGIAQGVAQVLWEQVVYDEDGNLLTSTLAEYMMPSAAEFPSFEAEHMETPTPNNPLGAKGIGESGTIGSTPAVHNAVVDAVSHFGVRHIDMPCTPERVWRAIRAGGAGQPPDPWREPPAVFATLAVRGAKDGDQEEAVEI